jgi:nitroreductase
MDAMQALLTRKSIRVYLDKEIPDDVIEQILRAGIQAPSGGNRQPWRFVVVRDPEKIKQFDEQYNQPWVENAPAVIVACANPHDTWETYGEEDQCWLLDTAAAMQNMLLAIHALGLGGVWVISCSKGKIRELCDIPLHWQIVSIIPFGYYKDEDAVEFGEHVIENKKARPRKDLSEVAFRENAGSPFGM